MVIDYGVIDTVRAFPARYLSNGENELNREELKVPSMDALVSPE